MFLVMQGVPSNEDLQWLSQELEEWKTVGRRLKIKEAKLTAFDILLLTGLKLCWDLTLSFYSLPMNFNSPNPSFSLLSFVPWSGSHKIFVFNQLLFRLLLVTYFTYLVKCVLITIWLYSYSECPSAESEGVMFYFWGGLKIFLFFSRSWQDSHTSFLSLFL